MNSAAAQVPEANGYIDNSAAREAHSPWRFALLVITVAIGLYGWTVDFPMEFDDATYLTNNPLIVDSSSFGSVLNIREFVQAPVKQGMDPDLAVNFVLRPIAYLTFKLNWLADGFHPRWYRVFNVVTHAANSLLVMLMLQLVMRKVGVDHRLTTNVPRCAALLFLAHPLATESVTYIAQRFTSLGAFFYLGTCAVWFSEFKYRRSVAVAMTVAAMLVNETAATLPLMLLLSEVLLLGKRWKAALRETWPLLLTLPLIPSLVLWLAWGKAGGVLSLSAGLNITNAIDAPMSHYAWLVTQITVVAAYIGKILLPIGLNLDPGWPEFDDLLQPKVLGSAVVLVALIASSLAWFWRRQQSLSARFAVFSTVWFFAIIFISSGLVPLPDNMAEHRTYLPSVGLLVIVAWVLCRSSIALTEDCRSGSYSLLLAIGLLVGCLSILTLRRNYDWRSSPSLWADTVEKSPQNVRAWCNLGVAQAEAGRSQAALASLRRAVEIEPRHYNSQMNLIIVLNLLGRHQEALAHIQSVAKISNAIVSSPDVVSEYASAHFRLGRGDTAKVIYDKILAALPNHRPSHIGLALCHAESGDRQRALHHFDAASQIAPLPPEHQKLVAELKQVRTIAGR
ncbi:MAG: tetratricopeptide repeat protein [Verrucomicrobiaceae bacterium]|nr:tetratricopeptide repeat protein [Verrucomicrobiaceae bacterium]